MKRFVMCISFALLLLFSGGEIQALTIIDTTPAWTGSGVGSFGYPDFATFGQVITVPTKDWALESFTFYMNLPATCTFRGFVYAWDGSKATGPALYESSTSSTSGSGTYEEITFYPMGLELTPGTQYVLFASTSKDAGSGSGFLGFVGGDIGWTDVYPNNNFVYLNNGTDEALWTAVNWYVAPPGWDLEFKATFVEPSGRILYWNDWSFGTDYMGETLKNAAIAHTLSVTTATGITDFESKVALGGWDLVILMIQGSLYDTPNFNSYISEGGKAILADWTMDATRGALFGVAYTGNRNQATVTIADGLLAAGVTNPMSLTNPGWPVAFSMGMTVTAPGIAAATFPNGEAAIVVGNKGKTIINGFLTDTPSIESDGLALFENEIMTLLPFTVTSANGGEGAPTGGIFDIRWIPSRAVSFNVDLSTDNGSTWKPLARQYGDNNFRWRVPLQGNNKTKNLIKVTAFNEYGKKVGTDVSNRAFTTEVVKLNFPNGGETWQSGSQHYITWSTSNTLKDVTSVKLYYTLNGGTTWKSIETLDGNPGSKLWTVLDVTSGKTNCKVKVVLIASDGTSAGDDYSDSIFTIAAPAPPPGINVENETGPFHGLTIVTD